MKSGTACPPSGRRIYYNDRKQEDRLANLRNRPAFRQVAYVGYGDAWADSPMPIRTASRAAAVRDETPILDRTEET
jgi:hypothetical protein